jgi:TonB family protein
VAFTVDTEGRVRDAYVLRSNNPWFERPALDAVAKWRFKPGRKDGHPVNVRMQVPMIFQLDGGGDDLFVVNKNGHDKLPPEFRWDKPPVPISTAYPVYPYEALLRGEKAEVEAAFIVGPDGLVQQVDFPDNQAPAAFTQSVRAMIDLWRFTPAQKDGRPSQAALSVKYKFHPSGKGGVPVGDSAYEILRELKRRTPEIYGLKDLDRVPRPISQRPPAYPTSLRAKEIEGEAVIEFIIDRNGDAQLPRIVSSTQEEFGFAAAQVVANWRFTVPRKNGQPVLAKAQIPVGFTLRDGRAASESEAKAGAQTP